MRPHPLSPQFSAVSLSCLSGSRLGLDLVALARLAVLGVALGQLVHYDLREHRIPNRIVLPAAAACAALSLLEGVRLNSLIGGGVLLALMLAVSLARPAWLGMGDVKLALLLLCGLHAATPQAILFAVELCAVVAVLFDPSARTRGFPRRASPRAVHGRRLPPGAPAMTGPRAAAHRAWAAVRATLALAGFVALWLIRPAVAQPARLADKFTHDERGRRGRALRRLGGSQCAS